MEKNFKTPNPQAGKNLSPNVPGQRLSIHTILEVMKPKSRRILQSSEVTESIRIRTDGPVTSSGYCSRCRAVGMFLTVDEAVRVSGRNTYEIVALAAANVIHAEETDEGVLRICAASLISVDITDSQTTRPGS